METKCKRCGVNNEYPSFHHCVVSEPTLRDWEEYNTFFRELCSNHKLLNVPRGVHADIKEFILHTIASRDAALLEFIESTKTKYPIDSRKISSTEIAINWANPLAHEVLDLVASHIRHDL